MIYGQIEFDQPLRIWVLLLTLPVIYGWWWRWQRATHAPDIRARLARFCFGLTALLLALSAAEPVWRETTQEPFVVFVEDRSRSVQAAAERSAEFVTQALAEGDSDRAAFLGFTGQPGLVHLRRAALADERTPEGSDPAAAVQLAAASIPTSYVPQIVLLTDGVQTDGRLFAAAGQAGAAIHAVPLPSFAAPEICAAEFTGPEIAVRDEPVALDLRVQANHIDQGQLILERSSWHAATGRTDDFREVRTQDVDVVAGTNRVLLTDLALEGDVAIYRATLRGFDDTVTENNVLRAAVAADSPPGVWMVTPDGESITGLDRALRGVGYQIRSLRPADLAASADALASVDLIVLSDVSAAELGAERLGALNDFVREGGGLIVAGGPQTWGESVYRDTALETLMPVTAAETVAEQRSNLALLLVIDKSTSMIQNDQDEDRLGLAKEAARRTVDLDLLTADDQVGILAFGNQPEWVSPIGPCRDKAAIRRRIDRLAAEGQTNMYPALLRAFLAVSEADTDRRHVIVLTDGVSSPGDFDDLARRMAAAGITISTVSLGAGADQTILRDLSRIAGGRHIHCERADQLTGRLVDEARSAAQADRAAVRPFVYRRLPGLSVAGAPPLAGYAGSAPRRDAELLLLAASGDPLLAWRRYGSGMTVAFLSQLEAPWGEAWTRWNGSAKFWQRLAQHARRAAAAQ